MINTSQPIITRFKVIHIRDERFIVIQIDNFPTNVRIGDEFYLQYGNSLISCKVKKLWLHGFQPQTYIFKGEFGYLEIEVQSVRSFYSVVEQQTFTNPVQLAYNNVLSKFKDEVSKLKERSKNYSSERIASELRSLSTKYKNILKTEISKEISSYNSKSEKKLTGNDLKERVDAALKSFDEVVKDSMAAIVEVPKEKKNYYNLGGIV